MSEDQPLDSQATSQAASFDSYDIKGKEGLDRSQLLVLQEHPEEVSEPSDMRIPHRGSDPPANITKTYTQSSDGTATASSSRTARGPEHGYVRTLPAWIDSVEAGDVDYLDARASDSLLSSPPRIHSAQHHYNGAKPERRMSRDGYESEEDTNNSVARIPERGLFGGAREPIRGRKWDSVRGAEPVIVQSVDPHAAKSWVSTMVRSSMYGPYPKEDAQRVDIAFLNAQTPGYSKPWRGDREDPEKGPGFLHNKKTRKIWYQKLQHLLLMHPLVPLAFRVTVFTTSVLALGLSASIYALTKESSIQQSPSTVMAIIVDIIAIPYIGYVTWDEYTGKPLGLRSPKAKMRLVLLDLFFIIFESANLAIAFGNLSDEDGTCRGGLVTNMHICDRVRTLCAFLLVALIAWSLTFSVSIFRVVERVGGREDGE